MSKSEKGFSVVETVLLVVVVGLVGFVGWYVFSSQKKTNDTLDSATSNSQIVSNKDTSKNESSKTSNFLIKEFGIQFPDIPEKGLSYEYTGHQKLNDTDVEEVTIYQTDFNKLEIDCAKENAGPYFVSNGNMPLARLVKIPSEKISKFPSTDRDIKLGGSYFIIGHGRSLGEISCVSALSESLGTLESSFYASLTKNFKKASLIK